MALDSRNRRSSAMLVSLPWRGLLPAPNGSVGASDRAATAYQYSGLLTDDADTTTVGLTSTTAITDITAIR